MLFLIDLEFTIKCIIIICLTPTFTEHLHHQLLIVNFAKNNLYLFIRGNTGGSGGDSGGGGGMQQKAPAMINTTSATSKIIHPPEDISLVSLFKVFLACSCASLFMISHTSFASLYNLP